MGGKSYPAAPKRQAAVLDDVAEPYSALRAMENQVSFLRDQRKGVGAQIGVILFWVVLGVVLLGAVFEPYFQKLLSPPERHNDLFIALGAALGFCIGAYAAFGNSRLAIVLAFPAIVLGFLPF